ncbi:MAG TPA: 50S ribosomal protein L9 [Phycisphaerae bacterium]|nr:50S ribosomal protein L9 [Phycisphaerae bacterium]HOJ74897.1 50S ribosomal protein L9 [Phycisphaerae bacterium]HOM51458.1 50S ribosomal protein L9 [Phycisphaerae bacterium]HON66940.1 50S ribosomal protein L9 [Phycisphaerae bacterium]HPP26986.1 50S ribosomal protein L9 [Phycisphaerae bacterium]
MKLLLRRDIPKVGLAGDVVEVTEGYARNYLLPQHLAVLPTQANMKAIEEDKRLAEEERKQRRLQLESQAARMRDVEVTIAAACNEDGHLYGSVGPREIAAALRDEGHQVDPKQVQLHEPIRRLDSLTVPVVFADDLRVEVKVWVVRETAADEAEEEEARKEREREEAREKRRREAEQYGYGAGVDALETDL